MTVFAYKGVSTVGRSVTGTVDADSPRTARARLRERGIFASDVSESPAPGTAGATHAGRPAGRRVSPRELSRLLRQLATLLSAGIPLVDALGSLIARGLKPNVAAALETIRTELIGGESLERAVSRHPEVFPPIYHGMIRAGEASGALDRVLVRIADHAESNAKLQGQLRSAMTYPAIMMLVGGGIVSFLLAYVVPQVTRVFAESGQLLPWPTRALMAAGAFLASYGLYLLLALSVLALSARYYAGTAVGRRRLERLVMALPWMGDVVRNVAMARFSHTIATMMSGGMTLLGALDMSRGVTGSTLVDDALFEAGEAVRQGGQLAPNLDASGLFNPMVTDMIGVGERSGELERMLERAAEALDEEVRGNVETMTSLIEPIMILLMAAVVLFVLLAVLLPVFEMNQMVR